MADFSRYPEFRRLVFLERGDDRDEALVLTLRAGGGIVDAEADAERSRRQIAERADAQSSSRSYRVLRRLARRPEQAVMYTVVPTPEATT
jgi:hypothetical protein